VITRRAQNAAFGVNCFKPQNLTSAPADILRSAVRVSSSRNSQSQTHHELSPSLESLIRFNPNKIRFNAQNPTCLG
jgi:hypothetical protein